MKLNCLYNGIKKDDHQICRLFESPIGSRHSQSPGNLRFASNAGSFQAKTGIRGLGWLLMITLLVPAQSTPDWHRTEEVDALRGTHYLQFRLVGTFLKAPTRSDLDAPIMVVRCHPGKRLGIFNGSFLAGWVATGTVLDSQRAQFRLDDGKIHIEEWTGSNRGTGVFFSASTLNTLLYGHILPHKENTGDPVHKIVLGLNEYLAGEIVMQFDMPDPAEIADVCGVLVHKRSK